MKLIPLTQGRNAIVDDADYEWLRQWRWILMPKSGRRIGYAYRHQVGSDGIRRSVLMHRAILDILDSPKLVSDHINGNGLDNQRSNLRACTQQQNMANQYKTVGGTTSPYKGVSWHKGSEQWQAVIRVRGHLRYLGLYANETMAATAYNTAAQENFGEFALLNQIPSGGTR